MLTIVEVKASLEEVGNWGEGVNGHTDEDMDGQELAAVTLHSRSQLPDPFASCHVEPLALQP